MAIHITVKPIPEPDSLEVDAAAVIEQVMANPGNSISFTIPRKKQAKFMRFLKSCAASHRMLINNAVDGDSMAVWGDPVPEATDPIYDVSVVTAVKDMAEATGVRTFKHSGWWDVVQSTVIAKSLRMPPGDDTLKTISRILRSLGWELRRLRINKSHPVRCYIRKSEDQSSLGVNC